MQMHNGAVSLRREKGDGWKVVAWAATTLAAFGFYVLTTPVTSHVRYWFEGKETHHAHSLPLLAISEGSKMTIYFHIDLFSLFPQFYRLQPDDCLRELIVNGQQVEGPELGACFHTPARQVELGTLLHAGQNDIRVVLEDSGGFGGLILTPSRTDPLFLGGFLALVLSAGFFLHSVLQRVKHLRPYARLGVVFYVGTVLRFLYVHTTPYILRGHDTNAHIDYIRYVVDRMSIPPAITGWEYFQPPLYYFLMAIWVKLNGMLGWTFDETMFSVQYWSLLFSIASFAIGLWVIKMLFHRPEDERKVLTAGAILAVFPGFIYTAARISNDPLMQFFSYLFLAILMLWWLQGRTRDWYLLTMVIGLGFLTKNSAYLFLLIAYGCLLLKRKMSWRTKLRLSTLSCTILVVMTGWYIALRALESDTSASIIGNVSGTHSGLLLNNDPLNFFAFHPLQNLRTPFNSPWDDATGRQFFADYFFRSSLFGEFSFGDGFRSLAILMVLVAEVALISTLFGVWNCIRKQWYRTFPLLLTTAVLLSSQLLLRAFVSFSPLQDFRYATLLCVPIAYCGVKGVWDLPSVLRGHGLVFVVAFIVSCATFLLLLFMQGT